MKHLYVAHYVVRSNFVLLLTCMKNVGHCITTYSFLHFSLAPRTASKYKRFEDAVKSVILDYTLKYSVLLPFPWQNRGYVP